ncbi:MAG: glycosyltransferase, partial [Deltaproteobacteria bacterium]
GFYFHDEMPRWKRRVYVTIEKLGARFGDFVFTQSAEDAEAAVKERICKTDEVMTIGNGVNVDRFAPRQRDQVNSVRKTLGITESGRVVGIVGRLVNEKGYPEFLEAAVQVSQRFSDTYFLLVGSRLISDHNQSIDNLLISSKNKLGDRLITTGFREDVPELMGAMDIFCLPSHREGMPRTIIEAMLMGKPIVATDIRGSREEVLPEETGLLIPTRSAEKLAEAICRLLSDPEMMKKMGTQGRERALQLYDERKVVSKQLSKIKDLLNLKRPKHI